MLQCTLFSAGFCIICRKLCMRSMLKTMRDKITSSLMAAKYGCSEISMFCLVLGMWGDVVLWRTGVHVNTSLLLHRM